MATRGAAFTATFVAWDTSANAPKTGDAANITPRIVKDGTSAALTSATVTEVDATNFPGLYKVSVSGAEANFGQVVVGGKSSTANIVIVPTTYQMERLPDAAPAANGGLPTVNASNYVAGVQGTLNTFDALDSAQDTQHATTQSAVAGVAAAAATAVWAAGTRTLSSFGTLASDTATAVWSSGTRTLSSFGTLVADTVAAVWGALLPGAFGAGSAGKLVGDSLDAAISSRSSHSAPDLSNLDTTVSSRSSHSAADAATAVWAAGTRTLSSFGTLVSDVATAVWGAATRTLSAVTGLGIATEAKQDTIIATGGGGPWTTGGDATAANQATISSQISAIPTNPAVAGDAMTLTTGERASVAAAVWVATTRTLTSFGTLVADIWANATRTLTALVSGAATEAKQDTIISAVGAIPTNPAVAGDAMTLTTGERASVATAVWAATTRTLSSFGTLIADIWANVTRTLTSGAAPSAADIADAVADEALADHTTPGTAGAAWAAAGSAGDPWATILPGAYSGSQAGLMLYTILTVVQALSGTSVSQPDLTGLTDLEAIRAQLIARIREVTASPKPNYTTATGQTVKWSDYLGQLTKQLHSINQAIIADDPTTEYTQVVTPDDPQYLG